jgi:hypothetical protein
MTSHNMAFKDFAKETITRDERERFLQLCGEREWLLPEGLGLFDVHVRPNGGAYAQLHPDEDHTSVRIGFSRARPCDGHTTLRNGRQVDGFYFDYMSDGMGMLTVKQMEFALRARMIIDQWITGEIDALPEQPFI